MESRQLPEYAVFDDYVYSQRIAVVVRWFVLVAWLFLLNYRQDVSGTLFILNWDGSSPGDTERLRPLAHLERPSDNQALRFRP